MVIRSAGSRSGLALALVIFGALAGDGASASDVSFSGTSGYEISGSQIRIYTGRVDNDDFGGTSGTLRLRIWATTFPYSGGTITGWVLGTYTLGQLAGGYYFSNPSAWVPYTPPPNGTYYITMTLDEYVGPDFVIRDHLTFSSTRTFGPPPPPPPPAGDLDLVGPASYRFTSKRISVSAAEVSNDRSSGVSGTLRLRLWATKQPYTGGGIRGYVVFSRDLGQLSAGYFFSNLAFTQRLKRPPRGTYYMTLTLEEFQNGVFRVVDYIPFSRRQKF